MKQTFKNIVSNPIVIAILFVVLAMAASIQSLTIGPKKFEGVKQEYSSYNNYDIFKYSYYHLRNNEDLYLTHPNDHFDLYKYSPTFAVWFAPLSEMPDWLGLSLWNIINALLLFAGIFLIPKLTNLQRGLVSLIGAVELMTSMQNSQSNAMMAGLLILAFAMLERKHYLLAALFIVSSAYVKIFGLVGFALFLFYPQKLKLGLYTILWTVILFVIPLIFIDFNQLLFLYKSWGKMLSQDLSASYGLSVIGWLHSWFALNISKNLVTLVGVILFLIPLVRIKQYQNYFFRLLTLVSILIWVVIFNHKAESPTFIIAMAGVGIWYMISEKNVLNTVLLVAAIVFTSLSPTDVFPPSIRESFIQPYVLKAVPCILIWLKVIYDMLIINKFSNATITEASKTN